MRLWAVWRSKPASDAGKSHPPPMNYILPPPYPGCEFPLGQLVITRAAAKELEPREVSLAIARHSRGDWGEVVEADRKANEEALRNGSRLFSSYRDQYGAEFWIITEADRSATTVLLPDDY